MRSDCALQNVYQKLVDLADQGRACALAVILTRSGSVPGRVGSAAVVDPEAGVLCGTIGGGAVEHTVQQRADSIIGEGKPAVLEFDLDSASATSGDPICGGIVRVLVDPTTARHRDAYAAAAAIVQHRQRGALLTLLHKPDDGHVEVHCYVDWELDEQCGLPALAAIRVALQEEKVTCVALRDKSLEQQLEVLIQPLVPDPILLIVGGGHVGQALAAQASLVGFRLAIIDDRREFTAPELFPSGADLRCGDIADQVARFPILPDTFVVIATRGHRHDAAALAACLHTRAAYIGMIGSRRKVAMTREQIIGTGRATDADLERVYAPIGLDIGSATVPEIAASIVAELIAVRRGAQPSHLRTR
jgi:xanthine dehydrogenase accessory factor